MNSSLIMNDNWKSKNTCIYNINYHIVWIPKYRKKILKGRIRERLIEVLFCKAKEINIIIKCHEVMSDHVHLFISATSSHNVTEIIMNPCQKKK
jgi:putative transposase